MRRGGAVTTGNYLSYGQNAPLLGTGKWPRESNPVGIIETAAAGAREVLASRLLYVVTCSHNLDEPRTRWR